MEAQERLDSARAEIEAAGGTVTQVVPLAHPDDPTVIVAHDITTHSTTPRIHTAVQAILDRREIPIEGLVPWQDPTIEEEGVADESHRH